MLRRLRARAVDGATMLARYLDASRERDRLRETVESVLDERDEARRERDEYARLVATREVEIDELLRLRREVERLTSERDDAPPGVCCMSCNRDDRRHGARSVVVADPMCDTCMVRALEASQERLRRELAAAIIERDARIPTDIDGAQAWAERHGVRFERVPSWCFYSDACDWPAVGSREWAVAGAVATALRSLYGRDMQAGGDA